MLIIIISILGVVCLITGSTIAYLGRSRTVSVKSIVRCNGDLYLVRFTKPKNMTWKSGSYAKFTLPDVKESGQKSRWLTIASEPDDNEIFILIHNSGSLYKKTLIRLPAGSKVKLSWLESSLSVVDGKEPIVCFASDVGIAAMRPIIKEWAGKRSIVLDHLDKGVTVFDKEMTKLVDQKDDFTYETSASLSQSRETLKNPMDTYGNKATYLLAGQPDDVKAMKEFLEDNGIDSKNIKTNQFRGLK